MAGFGVFMAFITYGFILGVVAVFCSIVLYIRAKRIRPESSWAAHRFRIENAAAPFLGLLWIVVSLVVYTFISNKVAHQSVSFSPDPYITLSSGYVVGSLNTYCGYVRAPGMNTDIPWIGPGYVRGIIDLTYSDGRFLGTYLDSHSEMQPTGTDRIRRFVFDTRDRSIQTSDTSMQADFIEQQTMAHQHRTSYWWFYAEHRRHWPDLFFWIFLLVGEVGVAIATFRLKPPNLPERLLASRFLQDE